MAIQHYDYDNLSSKKNQNVIAAAAYNARIKIYDETEKRMKYPHAAANDHVGPTVVLLPESAPFEYHDYAVLWNEAKKVDPKRQGKRVKINVPHELIKCKKPGSTDINDYDCELGKQIVIDHCKKEFVSKNRAVQIDFHLSFNEKGEPNFHAHVLITDRQIVNGKWKKHKSKKIYVDENGNDIKPIDSPILHFGKLVITDEGYIRYKKGYKELLFNKDKSPMLDKDGYPVMRDIRVPLISKKTGKQLLTKNGNKKKKKEWKSRKEYVDELDERNHVNTLRQHWYELQNEYFKIYNKTNQKGQIIQVDFRPYKEKYAHIPEEYRPKPTIPHGHGPLAKTLIEYNEKIKKDNRIKNQILMHKRNFERNEQERANETAALNNSNIAAENTYFQNHNPRDIYIEHCLKNSEWVHEKEENILNRLEERLSYNEQKRSDNENISDKRSAANWSRYTHHMMDMDSLRSQMTVYRKKKEKEIKTLAGKAYDTMTNQQKVKMIRQIIDENGSRIVGHVLDRNYNDGTKSLDCENAPTPYIPKNDVDGLLQASSRTIFNNGNYKAIEDYIMEEWDKSPKEEAPPAAMANLINMYETVAAYDIAMLKKEQWMVETAVKDYHPEDNNQRYNDTIRQIEQEEAAARKAEAARLEAIRQEQKRIVEENKAKEAARLETIRKEQERVAEANKAIEAANRLRAEQIKKATETYESEHKPLTTKQEDNLNKLLEQLVSLEVKESLENQKAFEKEYGPSWIKPMNPQERYEHYKSYYIKKDGKLNYARIKNNAKKRNIDVTEIEEMTEEIRTHYKKWHDDNGNILIQPRSMEKHGQTNEAPQQTKPTPAKSASPKAPVRNAPVNNTPNQKATGNTKETPDARFHANWKEDDHHEKSEMEIVDEELKKNWHPEYKR